MPVGRKVDLTLLQFTDTLTATGTSTRVWSEVRPVRGVFATLNSSERVFLNDKRTVFANYKFYTAYQVGVTITEKDRFKKGSRTFEIIGIDNPGEQNIMLAFNLLEVY